MTENELVKQFGFKRRMKNKEKFLVNEEYNITLKTGGFYFKDINTNETYKNSGDIISKFALINIEKDSKKYHNGLIKYNLNQKDFDIIYKENKQNENYFISHNKAKKLLEAQFNRLLCNALMWDSDKPNYEYYIKETYYIFERSESNIITLYLKYHYINNSKLHDFIKYYDIYNFDKNDFPINRRIDATVPLDLIIDKFLK